MAEPPKLAPEDEQFIPCPCCTLQVPAGTRICPHCRFEIPESARMPPEKPLGNVLRIGEGERRFSLSELRSGYGKWLLAAAPVLAALVILFLVYGRWSGHKISIAPNPELPVTVTQEKKDDAVRFQVSVKNEGEDVPDLSLRSIGVVVEIHRKDGRVEKKTVFPKSDFRGEGALLRGETGVFELVVPAQGIREVTFRSEVVDLGAKRQLIPAGHPPP